MKQVLKTNEWKAGLHVTKWLEPLNVSRHFFKILYVNSMDIVLFACCNEVKDVIQKRLKPSDRIMFYRRQIQN